MGYGVFEPWHLVLVLVIVLMVFGPGKLPSVGRGIGDAFRELKKATQDDDHAAVDHHATTKSTKTTTTVTTDAPAAATVAESASAPASVCKNCGSTLIPRQKFCANCGSVVGQPVVSSRS